MHELPWENTDVHDDSLWASPDAKTDTDSISRSIDLSLAGEPDKSITLIEDDIATDLEEVNQRLDHSQRSER